MQSMKITQPADSRDVNRSTRELLQACHPRASVQPIMDQDPVSRSTLDGRGPGCTSRQTKTHITETREVCYPWHPCYGQTVLIRKLFVRCGDAVCRCGIWRQGSRRSMEIPQWMLDRAICCTMRLNQKPAVSYPTLLELKELLQRAAVTGDPAVIQPQHHSSMLKGDADEMVTRSSSHASAGIVPSSPENPGLEDTTAGSPTESNLAVSANATPTSHKPLRLQKDTGGE
jgi:hypothetical protein